MATGSYDHPTFLTRQMIGTGANVAGANGTSALKTFPVNLRIRKGVTTVRAAGTSAGVGAAMYLMYLGTSVTGYNSASGVMTTNTTTATLGTFTMGTNTVNSVVATGDMNTMIQAGGVLFLKNGTDASAVGDVVLEAYVDPSATWTGPPGD